MTCDLGQVDVPGFRALHHEDIVPDLLVLDAVAAD